MPSTSIDNRVLRNASFPDLARYFKQLLSRTSSQRITDHLLAGLAIDSVPLRVLGVWTTGFADAPSIVKALRYEESTGVRRLAIKRFGKSLRKEAQIKALWDAVGGTAGLLKLLSELSVHDVQSFCHFLGRASSFTHAKETRQRLLTELTKSLVSEHFPDAPFQNPEKRPFTKFYANIVPSCTEEFVQAWEEVAALPRAGGRWMDHAHYEHVRRRCMRQLDADNGKGFRLERFKNLLYELPPVTVSKHLSQSMQFSIDFLRHLGDQVDIDMSSMIVNNEIIIPLLRRLANRRPPPSLTVEVLNTVANALSPRMKEGSILDFSRHGPLRQALHIWNYGHPDIERVLIRILRLAPETQRVPLRSIGDLLLLVRESSRYKLLALLLQHLRTFAVDIEKDSDLKDVGPWPWSIFACLPSEQSKDLLLRLVKLRQKDNWNGNIFVRLQADHAATVLAELSRLRPAGDYIDWADMHTEHIMFSIAHNVEVLLLELYISPRSTEAFKTWQSVVDERKTQAARAREQDVRAEWVRSALLCSTASESLELYEQTLLWARCFNKDFATVNHVYSQLGVGATDSVRLLSGTPAGSDIASSTPAKIQSDVKKGNMIMLMLLETAIQVMREPFFQAYHWSAMFNLFKKVPEHRLAKVNEIQRKLSLNDDEMFNAVWRDTLKTLILAEERCLMDEHKKLERRHPRGLLGRIEDLDLRAIENLRPAQCTFIDELARRRDELWQKHRRANNPEVVSLDAPWPKGLSLQECSSIQEFASVRFTTQENKGYAGFFPYLESRAKTIVFSDSGSVLSKSPTEKEIRKAIGSHVDDYKDALAFWVCAGVDPEDRKNRKQQAWSHALGRLSKARGLSAVQSALFWERIFQKSAVRAPEHNLRLPGRPDPVLPDVDDVKEPTEWNPDPEPERWAGQTIELEPVCLDSMLQSIKSHQEGSIHLLSQPKPVVVETSREAFWDDYRARQMNTVAPAAREGLLALALMLINSKCCGSKRLFAHPFPDGEDARFPTIYLDQEFLDREDISEEDGFLILERLARDAPLTLIAELCDAMLKNLNQPDDSKRDFEQETLRLMKVLVEGDRPNIVLDLVRRIVIDRPDASSWHRHMLTKGLFDRLTSERARGYIYQLASEIKTKLQEQAARKPMVEDGKAVAAPPLIKVTTVTALAQLLKDVKFIKGDEAIDILTEIFSVVTHPDIRVAIIHSLTVVLQKSRSDSVKAKVVDLLERHAVLAASSINERTPMSQQDWAKAEKDLNVPEVYEPDSRALQPVLSAIVEAYGSIADKNIVSKLYHQVLLPIYDASTRNNRRWLELFLRKHNLRCDADTLPLVPPKVQLLSELCKRDVQTRREEIFNRMGEIVLVNLDPPLDVHNVTARILEDRNLRSSNGGKHWLALFNDPGSRALSVAGSPLHWHLTNAFPGKIGAVPIPLIQDLVLRQLDVMIQRSDVTFTEQNDLLQKLARPVHKQAEYEDAWESNVRPLITRVVDKIEGIRKDEQWQRNPRRQPLALRDTFDMKLWLLSWPGYDPKLRQRPEHEEKRHRCRHQVQSVIVDLADNAQPYHAQLAQLRTAIKQFLHPADFFAFAVHLGSSCDGKKKPTLADYLQLEIAESLVQDAQISSSSEKRNKQVAVMIAKWRRTDDEIVRMTGLRTARKFQYEKEGRTKGFLESVGVKNDARSEAEWEDVWNSLPHTAEI